MWCDVASSGSKAEVDVKAGCGVLCCGVVWCVVLWYGVVWCGMVW